jgi:endoglucanase
MRRIKFSALLLILLMIIACGAIALAKEEITVPRLSFTQKAVPDLESFRFVRDLKVGWNLGNTFDAVNVDWAKDDLAYERAWTGVLTDPQIFDSLKEAGFCAVRIPVSWHNHVTGDDFTISPAWLARVKEIVDVALDRGLCVILNTHHDIAREFIYPDTAHLESSKRYLGAIWRQVSETFKGYDKRLIMESMNEPRLAGTKNEWQLDPNDPGCRDAVLCINALNQYFVDVVRTSGGENADRFLIVPGYAASVQGCMHSAFAMPEDSGTADRLLLSVHAYTPYSFALQSAGEAGSRDVFSKDNPFDVNEIAVFMDSLYTKSIALNVPVVIGEFGARDKNGNLQSRVDFTAVYAALARARGFSCFWWDNYSFTGSGELFGILDRKTFEFVHPQIIDALISNAE